MPTFHYEAMDASGGEISDTLEAADQKAANAELRALGYFVTRLVLCMKRNSNGPAVARS